MYARFASLRDAPQYIRNEQYYAIRQGCPTASPYSQSLLICSDWAGTAFMDKAPLDVFDECGLSHSSPCVDAKNQLLPSLPLRLKRRDI